VRRLVAATLLIACGVALSVTAAAGREARNGIRVVQVEGLIDAPNASLIKNAIKTANRDDLTLVLLQIDSRGAIVDVDPLIRAIARSRVPIVAWIGQTGAEAKGGAAEIARGAHALYISQRSTLGPTLPERLDATEGGDTGLQLDLPQLNARAVVRKELADGVRPTVGETIVQLDGTTVETAAGEVKLDTARVVGKGRDRRREANQVVSFQGLGLGGQIQHTLISPSIAFFLLVAGLALAVFEFFAASGGFAAAVGALAIVGGMYGFAHLPVRWWAVALLLVAAAGFAIVAQAGGSLFWSIVGAVSLLAGSILLYGGQDLRPAWWVIAIVVIGAVLFYRLALPSFIRARFSTPTVGREGMIGEMGTAEVDIDPDGVIVINGARWRARTNRATPIEAGEPARVVSVEGLVLEVEPETGGAKDYRERRGRKAESEE
jgi:membrane-bound serine protease (ClpP class)